MLLQLSQSSLWMSFQKSLLVGLNVVRVVGVGVGFGGGGCGVFGMSRGMFMLVLTAIIALCSAVAVLALPLSAGEAFFPVLTAGLGLVVCSSSGGFSLSSALGLGSLIRVMARRIDSSSTISDSESEVPMLSMSMFSLSSELCGFSGLGLDSGFPKSARGESSLGSITSSSSTSTSVVRVVRVVLWWSVGCVVVVSCKVVGVVG